MLEQVGSLIFTMDFVVLTFEAHTSFQLILRRPFLAIGKEMIMWQLVRSL